MHLTSLQTGIWEWGREWGRGGARIRKSPDTSRYPNIKT